MCNAEVNFHPITMKLVSLESLDYVECSGIVSYSIDTIYNVWYVIKFVTERHVVKINTVSRARFSKLFVFNVEVNFYPVTMTLVSLESLDYVDCSGIVSYSIDTIYNYWCINCHYQICHEKRHRQNTDGFKGPGFGNCLCVMQKSIFIQSL